MAASSSAAFESILTAEQRIAQLEQEVARLRLIASLPEGNPNPVLHLDAQGRPLYRNPAARQLDALLDAPARAAAQAQLLRLATASLAGDGSPHCHELRIGPYDYSACLAASLAEQVVTFYLTDVTQHRQAEAQREAQRRFYETVLDELPVEVVVLDEQRRYLYANPHAVADPAHRAWLLGGRTVLEYCARYGFPLALGEHRHRMFEQAQATDEPVFWDDCTPHAAGPLYHQRHFKRLSGAGASGGAYMLGCGLDVTARVLAEERSQRSEAARREQQDFIHQVLNTSPNPVYVRDAAGQVVFGNRALFRLDEQVGPALASEQLQVAKAREAAQYAAVDAQVLATNQEVVSEDPFTLPSGELRWFYTIKRPLARPDGTVHVLAVSTDITELKAAQFAAEAATTAREVFLTNMSHEIRTPMNGVLGMAALLAKTRLSPQQQDYLRAIRSSGTHLLGVLNDVLDVAKINSDKLELERIAFHLPDSIEQVVAPLALQAQQKGLAFVFEPIALASPWVLSDPFRLNQVLLNLLSNAIKFTEQGSVTLSVALLADADELLHLEFQVQDTGIGIAPEALSRIFDSFTQAQPDTARRYGGSGLGLTISRALAQQLGGELAVTSTPDQGSCFTFGLPLRKAEPRPASPAADAFDTGQLRGTRMLLAEDNLINRTVARLHLLHWGVIVDEVPDGPTALQLLEQHAYDVVLMDIQMPGMSGLEVMRHLRQHPDPARATTPTLALTANAFRSDTEKYLAASFDDFLTKPFAEEQLYAKLVGLLRQPAPPAPPRPYDLTRLRREARGREAFVAGMVNSFLTHMPPTLQALRAASEARDWQQVAELVHHIKPNLLALAIEGALAPVLTLEEPPLLLPTPDELVRQAAVQQLLVLVEDALCALPAELAPAPVASP